MRNTYSFLILLSLAITQAFGQVTELPVSDTSKRKLEYAPMAHKLQFIGPAISEKDWFNWCVSPIQGKDGKIHVFTSRWPANYGMEGWSEKDAEIAHFIGDSPEGPFKYMSTVLTSDMFPFPERMSAPHNSRVEEVDGKYILLYIYQDPSAGNTLSKRIMRTGMMIADDLNGPWRFVGDQGGMIIEPSSDPNHWTYQAVIGTENPAFEKIGDKYYVYFKAARPTQLDAKYGYAVADQLEGPYIMCDGPITDNISYVEDTDAFSYDGKHYLLTTDNMGGNSGVYGALILWESDSGKEFKLKDAKIGAGTIYDYWGTTEDHEKLHKIPNRFIRSDSGKLERPSVLFIDGKPSYLYAVGGVNIQGAPVSESYIFKLDW